MIAGIVLGLMLGGALTDQTVDVKKGVRLEVHTFTGDVTVKVWNRDAVRVEAEHSDRQTVDIRPGDQSLVVRGQSRIGPIGSIDYTITVPAWMAVNVNGMGTDVMLDGVGGDVSVETTRGDVHLRGGSGFISVKSVQGSITIERAKGRVEAQTVNDSVHVSDTTGDLTVGTTNGSIVLERIDTANLDASTVNGTIAFDGPIRDKGSYRLTTHNGAVSMAIPDKVNATLRVRTYGGSFRSTFPLKLDNQDRQNRFTLTLGDGSARIELESFNGSIALRRPGEPRPESDRDRNRGPRGRRDNPPAPPVPPVPPRSNPGH
jgi:Putative adhesin